MVAYVLWALETRAGTIARRYARWWAPPLGAVLLAVGLVAWGQPQRPSLAGEIVCLPIHEVERGDTLTKIAREHRIGLEQLVRFNPYRWHADDQESWDLVLEGEVIFIGRADCASEQPAPVVAPAAAVAEAPQVAPELWRAAEAAHNAGFRGDKLITALAVAGGESHYRPGAAGDTNIMNGKWGHSHGVWQIRTLRDGSDQHRTEEFLSQSVTNQAIAAWHISGGGTNWQPWGAYTNGSYRQFIGQATEAARAVEAARE